MVSVGGGSVGGIDVFVGGIGVLVAVKVGGGRGVLVLVAVGGTEVRVGGRAVGVRLGTVVAVKGSRVLRGSVGVIVTKRRCVSVGSGVREGGESVRVGTRVSVGTKAVTTCSVSAAAV